MNMIKTGKLQTDYHGIDELEEGYIENAFDSQVPYFEAENKDLTRDENGQSVLDSAVQATEESTRAGTINQEFQNIKNRQQERTQNMQKEDIGNSRE